MPEGGGLLLRRAAVGHAVSRRRCSLYNFAGTRQNPANVRYLVFCRYAETDLDLQWTIFGVGSGVAVVVILVVIALWKRVGMSVRYCCGINQARVCVCVCLFVLVMGGEGVGRASPKPRRLLHDRAGMFNDPAPTTVAIL